MSNKQTIPNLLVILGPTASGKTRLACNVAAKLSGEIISADSRQVYKHMDIGTGKDLEEFIIDSKRIPYHLIDIHEPGYKYNIAEFQLDFISAFNQILANKNIPILCGGSGLYIETALQGNSFLGIPMNEKLREEYESFTDEELEQIYQQLPQNYKDKLPGQTRGRKIRAIEIIQYLLRNPEFESVELPDFNYTIIGTDLSREKRRAKITSRLKERLDNGLIEEAELLLAKNLSFEDLEYYGLEYKWLGQFLKGEINRDELFEGLNIAIHQFAKRQMTWFRRMEKNGYHIHWLDVEATIDDQIKNVLDIYHQA